jgi:hypothetical protein
MEVARIDRNGTELTAEGTQLGATYELRYQLASDTLRLELVGERSLELELADADFFDLGWSPLFNSLPVLRDDLLRRGPTRDYVMRWVNVPAARSSSDAAEPDVTRRRVDRLGLTGRGPVAQAVTRGA